MVEYPRTNKERLRNDVIKFLMEKQCQWRAAEVSSSGSGFVQALTDCLWTIDGHHDVFYKQGFTLPTFVGKFVAYNCPETSKHRKRQRGNMSGSVLKSISSHLFDCLQGMYWDRENWRELKTDVEKVAQALANYASYLQKSCKKTLLNQTRTSPVRQLSDSLTFQFLPVCSANTSSSLTSELCERLNECSDYEYLQVEQYCPTQSMLKYNLMKAMKSNGFPFPTALVTYTHGNNVGNLNFFVENPRG